MPAYFPGWKIRLGFRLEEFGRNKPLAAQAPKKGTKTISGVKDPRAPLVAQAEPTGYGLARRFVLRPEGSKHGLPTPSEQARSSDKLSYDLNVIPRTVDWQQKGIRNGDTLNAEFRFVDAPLDPRIIRACDVKFFLGTWSPEQHRALSDGTHVPPGDGGTGGLRAMPMIGDASRVGRSFLRFEGWVDKWTVDWPDGAEPTIKIECTDNTRLFIAQEASMLHVLDMSKPVDEAIATYLSHYPQMEGITVEYLPATVDVPVLKGALQNTAHRPQLGPQAAKGGGGDERLSVWDYLTDVVGSIGHVIRVDGATVIIQTARSYTTSKIVRRPDDPFQGRVVRDTGEQLSYRRMVHGRNVSSMSVARNYASKRPTGVECRCWDAEGGKLLVGRFPATAKHTADQLVPGNAQPDKKWAVIRVAGIKDQKTLERVAQNYYEQVGRNEIEVKVKTRNLASFGGDNEDPDLLDAKTGDTFEVMADRAQLGGAPGGTSLTALEEITTSQGRCAEFLKRLGMADDAADAVAKAYVDQGYLTQFRLRTMGMKCSLDDGVEIEAECVNYVEVRADVDGGEEPKDDKPIADSRNNPRTVGP